MNDISSERHGSRFSMTSLLSVLVIAGIIATTIPATEYLFVQSPAPAFTWNGNPFRPIGVNYYPCTHPWTGTWTAFNATELASDMQVVKALGGNCIRTFLQWPIVEPAMGAFNMTIVSRVMRFFQVCSAANIAIMFSFFDYGAPAWANLPSGMEDEMYVNQTLIKREVAQLQLIIPLVDTYSAAFMWDIKNEPSSSRITDTQFATWVENMSATIRAMDSRHLIVVGGAYGNFENPAQYAPYVDAVCMHFYNARTDPDWKREFDSYVQEFQAAGKPVIVQEFGWPSYSGDNITESMQADNYKVMFELCDEHHIDGIMAWCLWEYPNPLWSPAEKFFGLLHPNGTWKPAAHVFHDYATGHRDSTWNFNGWEAMF